MSDLLFTCVEMNSLFLSPLCGSVREMYSRRALTGQRQASGSSLPTIPTNEGMLIGENADDPSAAAFVLGKKSLAGYRVTDPLLSNSTRLTSMAWTSDRLLPLARRTKKKAFKVKSFNEHSDKGSNGLLVRE